jgi:hypothetical protein
MLILFLLEAMYYVYLLSFLVRKLLSTQSLTQIEDWQCLILLRSQRAGRSLLLKQQRYNSCNESGNMKLAVLSQRIKHGMGMLHNKYPQPVSYTFSSPIVRLYILLYP